MSAAGNKILKGAREALAVARGKKPPARATLFGWAVMLPGGMLTWNACGSRRAAWEEAANMVGNGGVALARRAGFRVVRVSISTIPASARRATPSSWRART